MRRLAEAGACGDRKWVAFMFISILICAEAGQVAELVRGSTSTRLRGDGRTGSFQQADDGLMDGIQRVGRNSDNVVGNGLLVLLEFARNSLTPSTLNERRQESLESVFAVDAGSTVSGRVSKAINVFRKGANKLVYDPGHLVHVPEDCCTEYFNNLRESHPSRVCINSNTAAQVEIYGNGSTKHQCKAFLEQPGFSCSGYDQYASGQLVRGKFVPYEVGVEPCPYDTAADDISDENCYEKGEGVTVEGSSYAPIGHVRLLIYGILTGMILYKIFQAVTTNGGSSQNSSERSGNSLASIGSGSYDDDPEDTMKKPKDIESPDKDENEGSQRAEIDNAGAAGMDSVQRPGGGSGNMEKFGAEESAATASSKLRIDEERVRTRRRQQFRQFINSAKLRFGILVLFILIFFPVAPHVRLLTQSAADYVEKLRGHALPGSEATSTSNSEEQDTEKSTLVQLGGPSTKNVSEADQVASESDATADELMDETTELVAPKSLGLDAFQGLNATSLPEILQPLGGTGVLAFWHYVLLFVLLHSVSPDMEAGMSDNEFMKRKRRADKHNGLVLTIVVVIFVLLHTELAKNMVLYLYGTIGRFVVRILFGAWSAVKTMSQKAYTAGGKAIVGKSADKPPIFVQSPEGQTERLGGDPGDYLIEMIPVTELAFILLFLLVILRRPPRADQLVEDLFNDDPVPEDRPILFCAMLVVFAAINTRFTSKLVLLALDFANEKTKGTKLADINKKLKETARVVPPPAQFALTILIMFFVYKYWKMQFEVPKDTRAGKAKVMSCHFSIKLDVARQELWTLLPQIDDGSNTSTSVGDEDGAQDLMLEPKAIFSPKFSLPEDFDIGKGVDGLGQKTMDISMETHLNRDYHAIDEFLFQGTSTFTVAERIDAAARMCEIVDAFHNQGYQYGFLPSESAAAPSELWDRPQHIAIMAGVAGCRPYYALDESFVKGHELVSEQKQVVPYYGEEGLLASTITNEDRASAAFQKAVPVLETNLDTFVVQVITEGDDEGTDELKLRSYQSVYYSNIEAIKDQQPRKLRRYGLTADGMKRDMAALFLVCQNRMLGFPVKQPEVQAWFKMSGRKSAKAGHPASMAAKSACVVKESRTARCLCMELVSESLRSAGQIFDSDLKDRIHRVEGRPLVLAIHDMYSPRGKLSKIDYGVWGSNGEDPWSRADKVVDAITKPYRPGEDKYLTRDTVALEAQLKEAANVYKKLAARKLKRTPSLQNAGARAWGGFLGAFKCLLDKRNSDDEKKIDSSLALGALVEQHIDSCLQPFSSGPGSLEEEQPVASTGGIDVEVAPDSQPAVHNQSTGFPADIMSNDTLVAADSDKSKHVEVGDTVRESEAERELVDEIASLHRSAAEQREIITKLTAEANLVGAGVTTSSTAVDHASILTSEPDTQNIEIRVKAIQSDLTTLEERVERNLVAFDESRSRVVEMMFSEDSRISTSERAGALSRTRTDTETEPWFRLITAKDASTVDSSLAIDGLRQLAKRFRDLADQVSEKYRIRTTERKQDTASFIVQNFISAVVFLLPEFLDFAPEGARNDDVCLKTSHDQGRIGDAGPGSAVDTMFALICAAFRATSATSDPRELQLAAKKSLVEEADSRRQHAERLRKEARSRLRAFGEGSKTAMVEFGKNGEPLWGLGGLLFARDTADGLDWEASALQMLAARASGSVSNRTGLSGADSVKSAATQSRLGWSWSPASEGKSGLGRLSFVDDVFDAARQARFDDMANLLNLDQPTAIAASEKLQGYNLGVLYQLSKAATWASPSLPEYAQDALAKSGANSCSGLATWLGNKRREVESLRQIEIEKVSSLATGVIAVLDDVHSNLRKAAESDRDAAHLDMVAKTLGKQWGDWRQFEEAAHSLHQELVADNALHVDTIISVYRYYRDQAAAFDKRMIEAEIAAWELHVGQVESLKEAVSGSADTNNLAMSGELGDAVSVLEQASRWYLLSIKATFVNRHELREAELDLHQAQQARAAAKVAIETRSSDSARHSEDFDTNAALAEARLRLEQYVVTRLDAEYRLAQVRLSTVLSRKDQATAGGANVTDQAQSKVDDALAALQNGRRKLDAALREASKVSAKAVTQVAEQRGRSSGGRTSQQGVFVQLEQSQLDTAALDWFAADVSSSMRLLENAAFAVNASAVRDLTSHVDERVDAISSSLEENERARVELEERLKAIEESLEEQGHAVDGFMSQVRSSRDKVERLQMQDTTEESVGRGDVTSEKGVEVRKGQSEEADALVQLSVAVSRRAKLAADSEDLKTELRGLEVERRRLRLEEDSFDQLSDLARDAEELRVTQDAFQEWKGAHSDAWPAVEEAVNVEKSARSLAGTTHAAISMGSAKAGKERTADAVVLDARLEDLRNRIASSKHETDRRLKALARA